MKPVVALSLAIAAVPASAHQEQFPRWGAMVINLDRRPDRLQRFLRALRKHEAWILDGEHLCRVAGRDGHRLKRASLFEATSRRSNLRQSRYSRPDTTAPVPGLPDAYDKLVKDGWVTADALSLAKTTTSNWPLMTAGGIGLYLGHAAAWQYIVKANLDYGLVFEDDLTLFANNFQTQVPAILARHTGVDKNSSGSPSTWDFLYLQQCDDAAWKKQRVSGADQNPLQVESAWSAEQVLPDSALIHCTGAYIVTQSGARKLLAGALPASLQLDQQLSNVPGLRRASLSPPVAQCEEVFSDGVWTYRDTDVQVHDSELKAMPVKLSSWLNNGKLPDQRHPKPEWFTKTDLILGDTAAESANNENGKRESKATFFHDVVENDLGSGQVTALMQELAIHECDP